MNVFDDMLSNYKIYRKFKKGEWWLVGPRCIPYIRIWTRKPIYGIERIYQHEIY